MRTGSTPDNAVEIAYNSLAVGAKSQYKMATVNSVPFRYPNGLSPELLDYATRPRLIQLPPDTLLGQFAEGTSDEDRLDWFNDHVQKYGYWVARPDTTGLDLYVDGAPVTQGSERKPIKIGYTWMELAEIGQRRAVKDDRATEELMMRNAEEGLR
jgi:hypothetical protein